jgi:hypothetical protein
MDAQGDSIHSFIVRVWLEEGADEQHPAVWRGHVTHAVSRERIYITDLREILPFIASYLACTPPEPRVRWRRWLTWLRRG